MKKLFTFMLICALTLTGSFSASAERNKKAIAEKTVTKVLQGAVDDSNRGLTYNTSAYYNNGPDDFIVINDSDIIILDNVASRLQRYKNGTYYETIQLPKGNDYIRLYYSSDNKVYVLSEMLLTEIDLVTKGQKSFLLPDYEQFGYYVETVIERDDQIVLITETLGDYKLNEETKGFETTTPDYLVYREGGVAGKEIDVNIGNLSWTVDAADSFGYPLGVDENNNLFFYRFDMKYSVTDPEYCQILKFDQNGNQVASSSIDTSKWAHTPRVFAHVSESGDVYVLGLYSETFFVYRIKDGESNISEQGVKNPQYTVEGDFAYSDDSADHDRAMTMSNVTLSRNTVQTRALGMVNLTWTFASGNDRWSTYGATKPAFLNGQPLNSTQTGIPYCWGKYNGYSTVTGGTKFSTAIATLDTDGVTRKYVAGNAIAQDPVISRTVGVDCTGFVSSAYGFSTHQYSGNFYSDTTCFTTISSSDLVRMDLIIKTGHAILFKEVNNSKSGSLTVYECILNGTTDDKTVQRSRTTTELANLNYIYRRPKSWADCTHPYNDSYSYDLRYHWKVCSFCDKTHSKASHNYVLQANGKYKCSVCGCITNVLPAKYGTGE